MVRQADRLIGNIATTLDETGHADDTLLLVIADNGTSSIGGHYGGKGKLDDRGVRLPNIVRWPGVIAAGRRSNALTDFSDILPTLAEAAGIDPAAVSGIDGRSLLPHLRGDGPPPREWVFSAWDSGYFVRDERWRLDSRGRLSHVGDPTGPAGHREVSESAESTRARKRLEKVVARLGLAAKMDGEAGSK
ncbi:MAG: sulfatase-like hydrolase/transferase [Myxococcota bacterium]